MNREPENIDKQSCHNNVRKAVKEKEAMISYESKKNPKIKVTLEFGNANSAKKAEEELSSILKNMFIEKSLKRVCNDKKSALQSPPHEGICTKEVEIYE